jgi:hypothetical protein
MACQLGSDAHSSAQPERKCGGTSHTDRWLMAAPDVFALWFVRCRECQVPTGLMLASSA